MKSNNKSQFQTDRDEARKSAIVALPGPSWPSLGTTTY